jgi:hypothetical protein
VKEKNKISEDKKENILADISKTALDDESFSMKEIPPRKAILGS